MKKMTTNNLNGLALLDSAVLVIEPVGDIVYLNPAFESLTGLSKKELVKHNFFELFTPKDTIQNLILRAKDHFTNIIEYDIETVLLDNKILHLNWVVVPIESSAQVLIELRPADQQQRITNEERTIIQQQANRELIRNLAHEIKNPLGGIRGAAQLLSLELEDRPDLQEYTAVIREETLRLQSLVDRMLAPHKRQHISEINIHEILERVRSILLAEFHDIQIIRDYDVSLPELQADKEQLVQIALNLGRNAAQAMMGQGKITFRTRISRQVTLSRKRHPLVLELQIIDNGPGIPEEIKDQIFFPLVTGRADGTGLGLSLVQAYVHQHGGHIEFESSHGQTVFTVLLPLTSSH